MTPSNAWRALAKTAAMQHGAFNRSQAKAQGIDARQLRAARHKGQLRQPLSDVFVFASHPVTFRQRCAIASLAGAAMSHRCAAILHGFDGFDERATSVVEVCFERGRRRPLGNRVRQHTWSNTESDDITEVDGIRCTSIARTLFQLGQVCDRDLVEMALDSALRRRVPAQWIHATAARLRRPGPTGGNILFDILDDPSRQDALPESVLEALIYRVLQTGGLTDVRRQVEVTTASGVKRLDLAFTEIRLGIEGHSKRHHFGSRRESADNRRDLELAAVGWEIIYVDWDLAHDPDALIALVQATVATRRSSLRQVG